MQGLPCAIKGVHDHTPLPPPAHLAKFFQCWGVGSGGLNHMSPSQTISNSSCCEDKRRRGTIYTTLSSLEEGWYKKAHLPRWIPPVALPPFISQGISLRKDRVEEGLQPRKSPLQHSDLHVKPTQEDLDSNPCSTLQHTG